MPRMPPKNITCISELRVCAGHPRVRARYTTVHEHSDARGMSNHSFSGGSVIVMFWNLGAVDTETSMGRRKEWPEVAQLESGDKSRPFSTSRGRTGQGRETWTRDGPAAAKGQDGSVQAAWGPGGSVRDNWTKTSRNTSGSPSRQPIRVTSHDTLANTVLVLRHPLASRTEMGLMVARAEGSMQTKGRTEVRSSRVQCSFWASVYMQPGVFFLSLLLHPRPTGHVQQTPCELTVFCV